MVHRWLVAGVVLATLCSITSLVLVIRLYLRSGDPVAWQRPAAVDGYPDPTGVPAAGRPRATALPWATGRGSAASTPTRDGHAAARAARSQPVPEAVALAPDDLEFARGLGPLTVLEDVSLVADDQGRLHAETRDRLVAAQEAAVEVAGELGLPPDRADFLQSCLVDHVVKRERRRQEGLPPGYTEEQLHNDLVEETLLNLRANFGDQAVELARDLVGELQYAEAP